MGHVSDLSTLHVAALRLAYDSGRLTPTALVDALLERIETTSGPGVWIDRVPGEALRSAAQALERRRASGAPLPLYGIPFAVKDNIDVQGTPTTAACPAFAYEADRTAPAVTRLLDAGALFFGKTNLDQFATGLVGVRSPYGVPPNPFDPRYIPGGSSSGSAVAVARGLVSFALGTDTAGSGRVPAAFTNTVGLKPSPGRLSTRGVVPACRSLDCLSVFALTCADARAVATVAAGYDPEDPYSRPDAAVAPWSATVPASFRCGIPQAKDLSFFGDTEAEKAFAAALDRLRALGADIVEVDFAPFFETAALLYDGPWIAERLAGLQPFVPAHAEALLPVTREILLEGKDYAGSQVFAGMHRLAGIRQAVRTSWARVDVVAVPTTPTIYTLEAVAAEPRLLNARLGRYTNFVNLLDLAALAIPNGFRSDGMPTGITLLGPWGSDARLLALGEAYHGHLGGPLGATGVALPPVTASGREDGAAVEGLRLAVVGAHLSGQPLNHQLTGLGARLVRTSRTAPRYRLYALPGTTPPKPGLVRTAGGDGAAIEVEVWEMSRAAFGAFFPLVPPPLCIGTLELEDGERVAGFLCEGYATVGARDISDYGGWRKFRASER
jgi:allophanate hydrolase